MGHKFTNFAGVESKGQSELCLFGFITGYLMALRTLFDRWSTFIIVKYLIFSHGWYFQFIFFMYCILKFVNCIAIVRNLSLLFFYVKYKISIHFVYRPSRTMLFNESNQPTRQVNKQKGNIIAFEVLPFYILHNWDEQSGSLVCVTKRFVNISL